MLISVPIVMARDWQVLLVGVFYTVFDLWQFSTWKETWASGQTAGGGGGWNSCCAVLAWLLPLMSCISRRGVEYYFIYCLWWVSSLYCTVWGRGFFGLGVGGFWGCGAYLFSLVWISFGAEAGVAFMGTNCLCMTF